MVADKIKAAVETLRKAVKDTYETAITDGRKDHLQFNGLEQLGRIDALCDKIVERADGAVERTQPKVKKAKEEAAAPVTGKK